MKGEGEKLTGMSRSSSRFNLRNRKRSLGGKIAKRIAKEVKPKDKR